MRRPMLILALTALALTSLVSAADPPDRINYQGVLRNTADEPLDGAFAMTFRFFDALSGGNELLVDTHAAVTVTGGLFDVKLGSGTVTDGTGPGTYTSLARVFGDYPELYLEVEVNGEVLSPRISLASAGYALNTRYVKGQEIVSDGPLDIYVDAINGDDADDGLSPANAKQTITAAVNIIPAILNGDVTVNIADGTYQEALVLFPRPRNGIAFITLLGDVSSPESVVLDGSLLGDVDEGITVIDVPVIVAGMQITGFPGAGIGAAHGGAVVVQNCNLVNNSGAGLEANNGGFVEVADTVISGNGEQGIIAQEYASVDIDANVTISDNIGYGIEARHNSKVEFGQAPCSITNDDMFVHSHSTIMGYSNCTISGGSCTPGDPFGRCLP